MASRITVYGAPAHQRDVDMNEFCGIRRQYSRSKNQIGTGVDDDFDHTSGFANLVGLAAVTHVVVPDLHVVSCPASLRLGEGRIQ